MSGPGILPGDRAEHEDDREGAEADRQRPRVRVRDLADEVGELLQRPVAAARHAEDLRQLADDDRDREAEDEAR